MKSQKFSPQELTIYDESPASSIYAETFAYAPSAPEEEKMGNLYIVAEAFSNKTKKENAELVAEIASLLKNEYYKNTLISPLAALRFTLKKANSFMAAKKTWLAPAANLKLKVLAASLEKPTSLEFRGTSKLHLARLGDAAAFILRNGHLERIIPASAPAAPSGLSIGAAYRTFENIISGELVAGDRVVLATSQVHKVDETELAFKLKNDRLVEYLKSKGDGITTLALITLGPTSDIGLGGNPSTAVEARKKEKIPEPAHKTNGTYNKSYRPYIKPALLALALALAIGGTLAALKIKKTTAENKKEAETMLNDLENLKNKIAALTELKNETEAEELLLSAEQKMARLAELNYFTTTLGTLNGEFLRLASNLRRVEEIKDLRTAANLENNSVSFDPENFSLGRNKIIMFGGKSFYKFDLNRQDGNFGSASENTKIVSILERPDNADKLLIITQDQILEEYAGASKAIWSRPESGPALALGLIYSENFYFLGENGLIYKLPSEVSSTTLEIIPGELILWTKQNQATNYKLLATSFAVEGSIFGLADEHTIIKMANGEKIKEVVLAEKILQVFTLPNHKNLYALSAETGNIVVLDKKLAIIKRLSHPELKSAKSFYINSQERAIYFLKGKTVFSFEI